MFSRKRLPHVWVLLVLTMLVGQTHLAAEGTADMKYGTPDFKSVSSLAFGPDNVLFVGDSRGAAIFAIDVNDKTKSSGTEQVNVDHIDEKIAGMLGTTAKEIVIHDLAVHPASNNIYLSISRGRGMDSIPVILRVTREGKIEEVSLENVRYSKATLNAVPAADAKDRRGRSLRTDSITDIAFSDGYLYVAGLSNEEFASTLRRFPFPFTDKTSASSLEIFHVAHGRYETNAPVRTFMPYKVGDQAHILAAYTCTPLVAFPVSDLEDGAHVKGKTVSELGSGNRPLDMISFEKEGKEYILVANSNRQVMRINPDDFSDAKGLTDPLKERYTTAGVGYVSLPLVGVLQLDNLDANNIVVLQRNASDGSLNLRSRPNRRL